MTPFRIERIRDQMHTRQVDGLVLTGIDNVKYATRFTGSAGVAVMTEQDAVLLVDSRYTLQALDESEGFEVREYAGDTFAAIGETVGALKPSRLGFESQHVTYSAYHTLKSVVSSGTSLVPTERAIEDVRIVKDGFEIEQFKRAAAMADACFTHLVSFIRPGITERDVAFEIGTFLYTQGAEGLAFGSIAATGPNAAYPHAKPTDAVLTTGQMVKLDFGAGIPWGCSDITRTVFLGEPDDKQREVYSIVREAQCLAIDAIKPGLKGKEIDAVARDYIASRGYGEYFGHNLGHSMPKSDGPGFTPESETVLAPGMVMTVEPGIYIQGWGGVRIEDDIVITESGADLLTHSTKEIIVIS